MKASGSLVLSILLTCTVVVNAQPADSDRGWELLDSGDISSARSLFLDRLSRDPGDLDAANGLMETGLRDCDLPGSLAVLENRTATSSGQGTAPLRAFLAGARLYDKGPWDDASDEFVRASDLALAERDTASSLAALYRAAICRIRQSNALQTMDLALSMRELSRQSAGNRRREMDCDMLTANAHNMSSHLSTADSLYAQIASRAESAGCRTLLCDALNGRGTVHSKLRRPSDSIPFYEQSLVLARQLGDAPRTAKTLKNLGYDHTQARQVELALVCFDEAREVADRCGFQNLLGHILTGSGAAAEAQGDRQKAMEHFRSACLTHAAAGDLTGELGARQRLAYNLMVSGRYGEALDHYERCLEIISIQDSPYILNWVLAGLALTNYKLGYLDPAEEFYLRAMELNESTGDRMSVAWCHLSLGWLEVMRGDYGEALVQGHRSMEISRQIEDHEGVGDSHVVTAEVHLRLGNWDEARASFDRAVGIGLQYDLEELLNRAYHGLAEVCALSEQPDEARRYCQQALELARRWSDNDATIWALILLAEQSLARGDREDARRHLAEAASLQKATGHFEPRSSTRLLQARCTGTPEAATALATEALALAEEGCLPEREWAALSDLGFYQLAMGDTTAARQSQLRAIRTVESLRRAVGTDELRRNMLRPALAPYERMISLCVGDGMDNRAEALEALAFSERSHAQILAARLHEARTGIRRDNSNGRAAQETENLAGIVYLQARLQESGMSPDERRRLRQQVDRLEENIRIARLQTRDDLISTFAASPAPGENSGADLLGILKPGEQAISYFLGDEESFLFHLIDDRARAFRLPRRDVIEKRVQRYLSLRSASGIPAPILQEAEGGLFDLLLGPIADELATSGSLVVIPDGILHRLPFATLRGAAGRIIDHHDIFTAPSLRTLASLRQREATRRSSGPARELSIMAVGCGATGRRGESEDRRLHPFDDIPLETLTSAAEEAREISDLFARSMVLTGTAADEASFKSAPLNQAEVLHIAAHSHADEREVRRSCVLLNPGPATPDGRDVEDGLLQWGEVTDLDLRASLVTLAACRSAGGVLSVGEGVTGLTQAFLFAGSSCVLAVQSDIGDAYSRRFMVEFYKRLRSGDSAAAALRTVQLDFSGQGEINGGHDPWADFVLVGDGSVTLPDASKPGAEKRMAPAIAIGGLLALLLISIVRSRRES